MADQIISKIRSELAIPDMLYGTAWKEAETERLTALALECGFAGIDTANQRRHYFEEGVGRAVAKALANGAIKRDGLFLQSKFTYAASQDHRLPYDPNASFAKQVEQSLQSSISHLQVDYLDAYLLHGPSAANGLRECDHEVWLAMEDEKNAGLVRLLGVSNFSCEHLRQLLSVARIKPAFVQNRCYARTGWDAAMRAECSANGIVYQGFSLLTANSAALQSPKIYAIAERHQCSIAQLVFRFAQQIGMLPLTGTTNRQHMLDDLAAARIRLDRSEVDDIEGIAC